MRNIIVYGAGGFGRETALMIRQINQKSLTWNILGFCDDNLKRGQVIDRLSVLGGISELNKLSGEVSVVIAVAEPCVRREIKNRIQNSNVDYPVLIHPSVLTGDAETNFIGEGSIIAAGNIFTTGVQIKSFAIVNLACTIGHDVVIDSFGSIMPACSISGNVTVHPEVYIGTGARILPGVSLGKGCKIGAGAVVTANVVEGTTVVGVPARSVSKVQSNNRVD